MCTVVPVKDRGTRVSSMLRTFKAHHLNVIDNNMHHDSTMRELGTDFGLRITQCVCSKKEQKHVIRF